MLDYQKILKIWGFNDLSLDITAPFLDPSLATHYASTLIFTSKHIMSIETVERAQQLIQSYADAVWTFTSLAVIAESGGIDALLAGVKIAVLADITHIPVDVLEHKLNLLQTIGLVKVSDARYQLSSGMAHLIQEQGLNKFIAGLQLVYRPTNEVINKSKKQKLRVGWDYTDDIILQAQGIHSEYVADQCFPLDNDVQQLLQQYGAKFLDVGAGVCKISLRLCELFPHLKIIALEPQDSPYLLAKQNIQTSPNGDRITLRKTYVEAMQEENYFDVVWFPQVFFADEILLAGLNRVWQALKPKGKLISCVISLDNPDNSLQVKKIINSLYGKLRSLNEFQDILKKSGFAEIRVFEPIYGYHTITAMKS